MFVIVIVMVTAKVSSQKVAVEESGEIKKGQGCAKAFAREAEYKKDEMQESVEDSVGNVRRTKSSRTPGEPAKETPPRDPPHEAEKKGAKKVSDACE